MNNKQRKKLIESIQSIPTARIVPLKGVKLPPAPKVNVTEIKPEVFGKSLSLPERKVVREFPKLIKDHGYSPEQLKHGIAGINKRF